MKKYCKKHTNWKIVVATGNGCYCFLCGKKLSGKLVEKLLTLGFKGGGAGGSGGIVYLIYNSLTNAGTIGDCGTSTQGGGVAGADGNAGRVIYNRV
jgi:hypothetical protein